MPPIPQETIDQVLHATDIVEVIGGLIPLKKVGQSFQGLCPFHEEKTPSFSVSQERGMFRCFGCGKAGNALTFIRDYRRIPFPEAVKELAERAGITLPVDERERHDITGMLLCVEAAEGEFLRQLGSGDYLKPLEYLNHRKVRSTTREEFGIGFLGSAQKLIGAMKAAGVGGKEIPLGLGLLRQKDKGLTCPFMSRITFPIANAKKMLVGFGGRATREEQQSKYINSSDSPIFSKRTLLFGLSGLEVTGSTVIAVEGYFDVIALRQSGFRNVVGLLGSEVTTEQAKTLGELARNVVLLFDGDTGGENAILKALKANFKNSAVKAITAPEGDPDEIIAERGAEEIRRIIERAKPLREAAVEVIASKMKREHADALVEETVHLASEIPDPLEANLFIEGVSSALKLPEWALREKVEAKRNRTGLIQRKKELEKSLLKIALENPKTIETEKITSLAGLFEEGEEKKNLLNCRKTAETEPKSAKDFPISTHPKA